MNKITATATISCLVQISYTQLAATLSYYVGICSIFAAVETDADTSVCPLMKGLTSPNTFHTHRSASEINTAGPHYVQAEVALHAPDTCTASATLLVTILRVSTTIVHTGNKYVFDTNNTTALL